MEQASDTRLFYIQAGKNIRKYRELRKMSLESLAAAAKIEVQTLVYHEAGEITISMERLGRLAAALDITMTQLTEGAFQFLASDNSNHSYIDLPVAASFVFERNELRFTRILGHEPTPREWLGEGDYFYIRAEGSSMTDIRIFDGDLLLIRRQDDVEDGDIAAVLVGSKIVLSKAIKQNGSFLLESTNPYYPSIDLNSESTVEARVVGKLGKIIISF